MMSVISYTSQPPAFSWLDISFKVATIILALLNSYIAFTVFRLKDKKETRIQAQDIVAKENDRKIQLLKTLVLDHNLKYFYEFVDSLKSELNHFKKPNLSNEEKQIHFGKIEDLFIGFRRKFLDPFLAIDKTLYHNLIQKSDNLLAHLTNNIFDPGINISHTPKFDELIEEKLLSHNTDILEVLFKYRG